MNCLPVVDRELRVAARKRSTFWMRVAAAVTGLVIASGFFALATVNHFGLSDGVALFHVLSWLGLVATLSAGLFFTSDCLSEEKREGTLGLLFLTDLRGYDVAAGKLMATSLRGFYTLLAVLPVLALTLFMGGVTAGQYWKASLALVNALFLSLAAGMAVSAMSRDSQKALTATFLVLLLLAVGGPVADSTIASTLDRPFKPFWCMSSPGYVLTAASMWGSSPYWIALGITQGIGWAMLALACVLVPRTWQERKRRSVRTAGNWAYAWRYGNARCRLRLRRKLLERDAVVWLTCHERWQARGVWALALAGVGGFVTVLVKSPIEAWMFWNYVAGLFVLLLYVWTASQASRLLLDARRSGMLELLLISPVSDRQIVRGQWQALLRTFGIPVALLLGLQVAATAMSQLAYHQVATQVANTTVVTTNQSGTATSRIANTNAVVAGNSGKVRNAAANATPPSAAKILTSSPRNAAMVMVAAGATALSIGANLAALCWFGLWMGMTSRSANLATLKTLVFVQVIPWLVTMFAAGMALGLVMPLVMRSGSGQSASWFEWWPLVSTLLTASISLAKDAGFIVWSRDKLYSSLRTQATCGHGQPGPAAPPPLPAAIPAPPVILTQG